MTLSIVNVLRQADFDDFGVVLQRNSFLTINQASPEQSGDKSDRPGTPGRGPHIRQEPLSQTSFLDIPLYQELDPNNHPLNLVFLGRPSQSNGCHTPTHQQSARRPPNRRIHCKPVALWRSYGSSIPFDGSIQLRTRAPICQYESNWEESI